MKKIEFKQVFLFMCIGIFAFLSCSKDEEETVSPLGVATAYPAINLTNSSFTANWTRVYRAEKYFLDVSTSASFSTFLPNYNALPVTGLTAVVSGLSPKTTYYYRIRAAKGTEISTYSNVITTETISTGPEPTTPLKEKATTFSVGVAVNSFNLTGSYDTTIRREFNSITAENEMKMQNIFTSSGTYNWAEVDKLLAYATANKLNVHGHALIWHSSIPEWLKNYSGTDAAFELEIKNYITAVVTHCKGKVKAWDVVNEAVNDGGGMRNTLFRQRMGADYVTKCFRWAREADPNVLLFYNDYNTSYDISKQNAVYALVDVLKTNNVIDGVGIQMHVNYNAPTKAQITVDTNRIVEKGLKVHYSEVDVRANSNDANILTTLTPERELAQKLKYKELVQVYNAIPALNKYAITMWGLKDNDSWLLSLYNRPEWPLLFDANFNIKKTHTGFLEGLD